MRAHPLEQCMQYDAGVPDGGRGSKSLARYIPGPLLAQAHSATPTPTHAMLASQALRRLSWSRNWLRVPVWRECRPAVPSAAAFGSQPHPTEAIDFQVLAMDRQAAYERWVRRSTPYFRPPEVLAAHAYFAPFWVFHVNMTTHVNSQRYDTGFSGPAAVVYAGHNFRRPLMEVVKSDASLARPFDSRMLNIGEPVDVDPWLLYERTALDVAKQQVTAEEQARWSEQQPGCQVRVDFTGITSRRIMMPVHVIDYKAYGSVFRVMINGVTGEGFGLEQVAIAGLFDDAMVKLQTWGKALLASTVGAAQLNPKLAGTVAKAVFMVARVALKLAFKPFFFGAGVLGLGVYRVFMRFQALSAQRATTEQRARAHEEVLAAQAGMSDEWIYQHVRRERATAAPRDGPSTQRQRANQRARAEARETGMYATLLGSAQALLCRHRYTRHRPPSALSKSTACALWRLV